MLLYSIRCVAKEGVHALGFTHPYCTPEHLEFFLPICRQDKILMRMMEGRRGVFLAWARYARRRRQAKALLSLRLVSLTKQVFEVWRKEAMRQKKVREFAIRCGETGQVLDSSAPLLHWLVRYSGM